MSSPQLIASSSRTGSEAGGGSDEDMDWEEVSVPHAELSTPAKSVSDYDLQTSGPMTGPALKSGVETIEITLKRVAKKDDTKRKKQAEQIAELRALRLTCHKIHTVALLANAIIRNKLLNDPLLHARLLSLTPIHLQTSFDMITKKRHPEAAKRGRLFESSMMRLTQWWYEEFFTIEGFGHIKSRTFDEVQKILLDSRGSDEPLQLSDLEDDESEVVRSSKSLMKHALKCRGSRDVSSQLFTALCRALGIPARLVVSLQSVPWQAGTGKLKSTKKKNSRKGKEKAGIPSNSEAQGSNLENEDVEDDDMEEIQIPDFRDEKDVFPGEGQSLSSGMSTPSIKGKEKMLPKNVIKLRKSKSTGQKLGSSSSSRHSTPARPIGGYPPVFWTEVYSKPDGRWMPVDPTRYIVNKRKTFEPPQHDRNNRMVYVIAVEEDGYCRDVTARYARDYGTKTSKAQLGGKGRKEWWESVMSLVTRPYRLLRDDAEDEEFEYNKYIEGMPTSVAGFKNHPLYVLEQHLKREEVIDPKVEVGKFRGEPVYPRSNVVQLKTAENWIRVGRRVKEGVQAMKWVKQRAVTIHRRRAMELAQQEGDEMLQGLYSEAQTEIYVPDPVVDGIVPKNEFGNIDLYTPSMLPKGAAHIPYKGAAKIAKKLGFDYAEAVTNFEFKKGRAFPVLSGIVVAAENEEILLEAYWEAEREAEEKEQIKRRERVIKRWTRLINGLRIRQRLQEQYANGGEPSTSGLWHENGEMAAEIQKAEIEQPGGFLTEADAVVQPFHLPRFEHGAYEPELEVGTAAERDEAHDKLTTGEAVDLQVSAQPPKDSNLGGYLVEEGEDDDLEEILPVSDGQTITSTAVRTPKSMRELAEESATQQMGTDTTEYNGGLVQMPADTGEKPPALIGQDNVRNQRPVRTRNSNSSTPSTRRNSMRSVVKTSKRRNSGRKRNTTSSSALSSPSSGRDDNLDNEDLGNSWEESDDDIGNSRQRRTGSSKSILKRKRTELASTVPPPSTRVLRTRVPKTAEQVKVEKEVEAAYRKAIAQ
ncbi:Rad4-domain-containing protein [Fomitiporia mediterranea MF3/22]|uniref:Rad4-domain-containing protein n=1 Tax=Fomitiporia mediterranea (strain MF3/22) TaxID=694068 RepID=UPI00044093AA|nr:Rad4-domain-containing protein [Fomitiporia mediterranea MF3/22]EJC98123.1 Rad4-domain-containing protein [Fomitiporia mediterranea MF3/22]